MASDLALNLRTLCSYYQSIAEVCRKAKINRQQFNKYLGEQSVPALHTIRKINDFFGLEEGELFLPHDEFLDLISSKPQHTTPDTLGPLEVFVGNLSQQFVGSQEQLSSYCGYYYEYFCSPANPGQITKSLVVIYTEEGQTYFKMHERIPYLEKGKVRHFSLKYKGFIFSVLDRLYLVDTDYRLKNNCSMRIFYPPNRTKIRLLTGVGVSLTGNIEHKPYSFHSVLELINQKFNMKDAIKQCTLYPFDSPLIDEDVKERLLGNSDTSSPFMLAYLK